MENEERFYPNEDEIYEFFDRFIKLEDALEHFKKNGILLMTNKRSEVARYASRMFYGFEDFEAMKSLVETKHDYEKVSGFHIRTQKNISDLRNAITIGNAINERSRLMVESTKPVGKDALSVTFTYVHKTPGKMNWIDSETRRGEFRIEKGKDGSDKVVMFSLHKNEDYASVREILNNMAENADADLDVAEMNIEDFEIKTRIEFIDRILLHEYADWKLDEVKELRVKKPDEEIPTEVGKEDKELLKGISDAVLQGTNLRNNPFVVKCQNAGYYFPSVVMKMANQKDPVKVDLGIYFKLRPEMPEIIIEETYQVVKSLDQKFRMEPKEKEKILNIFLHDIMDIYRELAAKSPKKPKGQAKKKSTASKSS